ncbi:MAG: beta-aspartyl-peptidase [Candidatus Saccharicenans sp.]|nr:beta-aspartyl-peptidase [Candidatus Saccharicenans sp.]
MVTLIKNIKIIGQPTGPLRDMLIAGERIEAVTETGRVKLEGVEYEVIDGTGLTALPGFIDPHVHILGGGGEGGPATRAPEIRIEDCLSCGVTSVIGCLGTDSVTRHMSSLLAKARALEIEGLSTWIYTGAYNLPAPTITGSVRSDLTLIDKVIGAGEIAISDHRSSQPTFEEFLKLVAECRVGGLLGGKAGVAHFHLGDGRRGLEYFFRMLEESELPATQVVATHANRNRHLFSEALEWLRRGGFVDFTCGPEPYDPEEVSVPEALNQIKSLGLPLTRVTVSSDANGSLPVFDEKGKLVALTVASQKDFIRVFREVVQKNILSLEEAATVFSTNAADFYRLPGKGKLLPGYEADLLLLDEALRVKYVFSRGRMTVEEGRLKVGSTFVL